MSGSQLFPVPWYVPLGIPEEIRPANTQVLFQFRGTFQIKPQPFWINPRLVPPADVPQETPQPNNQLLFQLRGTQQQQPTLANGLRFWTSYVITPDEELQPQPVNQQTLFAFRSKATRVQPQPFWTLQSKPTLPADPDAITAPNSQALFSYRTNFQTVGQPFWSLQSKPNAIPEPDAISAPNSQTLFQLRSQSQQISRQPFWLWSQIARNAEADESIRVPDSQALFRFRVPQTTNPPQPFFLGFRFIPAPEPEPFPVLLNQQLLFAFRGYAPTPPVITNIHTLPPGFALIRCGGTYL